MSETTEASGAGSEESTGSTESTYRLELHASGPFVGCESTEVVDLSDYGYTDEEWDGLTEKKREDLLFEWGQEFFWNEGYEFNAKVEK